MKPLMQLANLNSLTLNNIEQGKIDIFPLSSSLTKLSISNTPITAAQLMELLSGVGRLEELHLAGADIGEDKLEEILKKVKVD